MKKNRFSFFSSFTHLNRFTKSIKPTFSTPVFSSKASFKAKPFFTALFALSVYLPAVQATTIWPYEYNRNYNTNHSWPQNQSQTQAPPETEDSSQTNEQTQAEPKNKKISEVNCKLSDESIKNLNERLLQLGFGSELDGQWQDHADIMAKYLNDKKYYNNDTGISDENNMNKLQLMRNIIAYDAVRGAKEIVLEMMRRTGNCFQYRTDEFSKILPVFLSFKPWNLESNQATKYLFETTPNKTGIFAKENLKKFSELGLEQQADKELEPRLRKLMNMQARGITSHLVNLTFALTQTKYEKSFRGTGDANSKEAILAQLYYPNVAKLVRLAYLDHQIGRTLWLGRAFLAATEILATEQNIEPEFRAQLEKTLSKTEGAENFRLENILGREWRLPNEQLTMKSALKFANAKLSETKNKVTSLIDSLLNGTAIDNSKEISSPTLPSTKEISKKLEASPYVVTERRVPIENMSYVLTRNVAIEGAVIPSGALPPKFLTKEANEKELIGNYIGAINFINAEDAKDYDFINELRDKSFYRTLNRGYSHIGYAHLRTILVNDKEITMSWVIDNYPSPAADAETAIQGPYNSAGVRFIGLEQYYKVSAHTNLMVATPDPDLFAKFANSQISKIRNDNDLKNSIENSILREVYKAIPPELDETGKPIPTNKGATTFWKMDLDISKFTEIHQQINTDHSKWFQSVTKAATDTLTDFMYRGMTFVWITPNGQYYHGGAYCSFTGLLAYKLGTGLDVQIAPDRWDTLVNRIKNLYEYAETKVQSDCKNKEAASGFVCKQLKNIAENIDIKNVKTLSSMPIVAPSGLPAQGFIPNDDKHIFRVEAPFIPIQDRLESGVRDVGNEKFKQTANVKAGIQTLFAALQDKNSEAYRKINRYSFPEASADVSKKMVKQLESVDFNKMNLDPAEIRGLTMDIVESNISKLGCGPGSLSLVCGKH